METRDGVDESEAGVIRKTLLNPDSESDLVWTKILELA